MKGPIVITAFLLFAACASGQSPTVKLNIKMEVLPELKDLLKDTEMRVWVFRDTNDNSRKSFRDFISLRTSPDSCIGLLIDLFIQKGSFSKYYNHFYEIPCTLPDSIINIVLRFPEDCAYNRNGMNRICPKCGKKDKVIPIWYGLPIPNIDKYGNLIKEPEHYSAGCAVSDCDPNWYCKRDKYEF